MPTDYATLGNTAASPNDLFALRELLQRHVEQANALGHRVAGIADAVFGSVPSPIGEASVHDRPPASLAELIGDLGRALSRIETSLNRL